MNPPYAHAAVQGRQQPLRALSPWQPLRMPWAARVAIALALVVMLGGCAVSSPQARREHAQGLAAASGWQASALPAGRFVLTAMHPAPRSAGVKELAIFIEGDGLAWLNTHTPSSDPTPQNPIALRMALAEPHRTSAYLARPCQFTTLPQAQHCTVSDWTGARFSGEVVTAMNIAVSQLKQRFGAERLVLVGYSGGGAVAALVAARRKDVSQLVTVAAVLDIAGWTREQGLSPLDASLNPADAWQQLQGLAQLHFVGGKDKQTGRAAVQPFIDHFKESMENGVAGGFAGTPSPAAIRVVEEPSFTHVCCWAEKWPQLSPR